MRSTDHALLVRLIVCATLPLVASHNGSWAADLTTDVRELGWIAFSAPGGSGDWDLFIMRPDGSDRRSLTETPATNEAGVRFSPDGKRILYYRMPREELVDNNTYGTWELVIADADGGRPVAYGRGLPWASWGPDGQQIAVLQPSGIQFVDLQSRQVLRTIPRQGIVQQLVWSPDGKWLAGTANGLGPYWNVARIDLQTGIVQALSETNRYNCTPDWMPDSRHVLYARGIIPEQGGCAELWVADVEGRQQRMVFAEGGFNIYGGCSSPDGKMVIFTRSEKDLGPPDGSRTHMALIRWEDRPRLDENRAALQQTYTTARPAQCIDLGPGWEPHWTFAPIDDGH